MAMTSTVPYLIRAINEWIIDNGFTPYLIVDASKDGTSVPETHVKDGQIVLNISSVAVRHLVIDDQSVSFSGRFQGVAHEVSAPINAVLGIVARENGEGMWFPKEDGADPDPPREPGKSPTLRVVK